MGQSRGKRVSRRDAVVVVAIAAALLTLVLSGAIGSASGPPAAAPTKLASHRFGFTVNLPSGWSRAAERLVPKLLDPREILSAGTFAMPVGGGGNCGREPVAAIDSMHRGDALVSIQEFATTPRVRSRLARTSPPLSTYSSAARLDLRREPRAPGERVPTSQALWSATLPFRDHGRGFDALVYLKGTPSPARLEQVVSILKGLSFQPGAYVALPGSAGSPPTAGARALASPPPAPATSRLAAGYGPYLGVRCHRANSPRCDRVGLDIVLRRRAAAVSASIGGRRLRLRTPGLHNGVRGRDWVGTLRNAGLGRRGSPLHIPNDGAAGAWAGDPPVYVTIRVTATDAGGGRHSRLFPHVFLSPGWG
jgi:hypothetical protein